MIQVGSLIAFVAFASIAACEQEKRKQPSPSIPASPTSPAPSTSSERKAVTTSEHSHDAIAAAAAASRAEDERNLIETREAVAKKIDPAAVQRAIDDLNKALLKGADSPEAKRIASNLLRRSDLAAARQVLVEYQNRAAKRRAELEGRQDARKLKATAEERARAK